MNQKKKRDSCERSGRLKQGKKLTRGVNGDVLGSDCRGVPEWAGLNGQRTSPPWVFSCLTFVLVLLLLPPPPGVASTPRPSRSAVFVPSCMSSF